MKESIQQWLSVPIITLGEQSIRIVDALSAALILIGCWLLVRVILRTTRRAAEYTRVPAQDVYILNRVVRYVVYTVGILVALSMLGVSFSRLAIIAGALGVGIGFGLQSIVNNFVCGIIILFEKSLRIGDFVELPNGLLGEVKEINVRSTLIRTLDNADILVPNADFINNQVYNWTLHDAYRRFSIPFGVAYGSDLEQVTTAALEAAKAVPVTLYRKGHDPAVFVTEMSDSSINCVLSIWAEGEWVKRPGLVKSMYLKELYLALQRHQIRIPFPQLDVHMQPAPEQKA